MAEDATTPPPAEESSGDTRLAILLAMAMFVRCLPIESIERGRVDVLECAA
jgi:hypothetical protein